MSKTIAVRWALSVALLGGLAPAAVAQQNGDNTSYGTTAAEFLQLGANARGTALGPGFAAIVNDASALYYNPAGAALMKNAEFQASTYDYVAETDYAWGGIAFPFSGGSRAFGIQLGTFGFDDQPVYTEADPDGLSGATYSVNQTFVGVTYAQNFSDRFSAGLTAKGVFDQLGDADGSAFAVDFGTNFHSRLGGKPISFSFTLTNLGTSLSYSGEALNVDVPRGEQDDEGIPNNPQPGQYRTKAFSLPTTFRVGLAYDLVSQQNTRLTVLGDFNQQTSNKAGFAFGTELAFSRMGGSGFGAAVRGSYTYQPANNLEVSEPSFTALSDEENLQGLAFGGGLSYATNGFSLGVDYAYRYMGILGPTNFFSFAVGF